LPRYDTQEEIYNDFFTELKTAGNNMDASKDKITGDVIFNGDVSKWKKLANSLRMRFAMRISNVAPQKAQEEFEAALQDEGGIFRFDAQSVAVVDGADVVAPADGGATGRWVKIMAATQSHEALKDLQGGAVNDHLHLTTAEKNGYDAHLADYGLHLTAAQNTLLDSINASAAEINYLVGVTSSVQTQLDGKQASLGYTPVNKAGDTMLGALYLSQDPVAAMEAVTLQYLQNYVVDCGVF
jgi:RNAse (barnase) inhibitor barstar